MGPNSPNPKKLTQKHYMSPTISAASKAIIPKKKILAERNEASESIFSEPVVQKTSNHESKTISSNPVMEKSDIASPQGFEPNGNEENVVVSMMQGGRKKRAGRFGNFWVFPLLVKRLKQVWRKESVFLLF